MNGNRPPIPYLSFFRYVPGQIVALSFLTLITAGLLALNTYLLKILYDDVYPSRNEALLRDVCLILAGCLLLILVCNILKQLSLARVKFVLLEKIRLSLLDEFAGYEYGYFVKVNSSDVIKRLAEDCNFIAEGLLRTITGISYLVVIVVWLAFFLVLFTWMFFIYLFIVLFFLGWAMLWRRPFQRSGYAIGLAYGRLHHLLWKAVLGIKMIKFELLHRQVYRELDEIETEMKRQFGRTMRLGQALWGIIQPLPWFAFLAILYIGAAEIQDGTFTLGSLIFCLLFVWRLIEPLIELNTIILARHEAQNAKRRIQEFRTGTVEREGTFPCPPLARAIRFTDVSFHYPESGFRLEHVNLEIPRGTSLAVVGRTGSGKSTLAHLLLRLYDPTTGVIYCDDTPIAACTLDSLRSRIALVPQEVSLYGVTLRRNVDLMARLTDSEIRGLLDRLLLGGLVARLPQGLDTVVVEGGSAFSGGERQRLGIARALALGADVYVFDEVTADIDPETETRVLDAIFGLGDGVTRVFITHNLRLLSRMDEICLIAHGTARLLSARERRQGMRAVLDLYDLDDRGPSGLKN